MWLAAIALLSACNKGDDTQHTGGGVPGDSSESPESVGESGESGDTTPPTGAPSFVFVLADDLDEPLFEDVDAFDTSMAAAGATFARHYVTSSLCCPSRASMLRGQYTHNHGIKTNDAPSGGFQAFHDLDDESSTIGTWLHDAGYKTSYVGKFMNGYPTGTDETYIPPGWDDWFVPTFDPETETDISPYVGWDYDVNDNGAVVSFGSSESDFVGDVLQAHAIDFIDSAGDAPFLLYIGSYTPHSPYAYPPRYEDAKVPPMFEAPSLNEADVSDKPSWVAELPLLSDAQLQQYVGARAKRYKGMLAVEETVEALIAELDAQGRLDNTYVIFTSDNGYHMGPHRLPEGKLTAFEEDVRVPLQIRGPGIEPGSTIDELTLNLDLPVTIADLAGVTPPDFVDGRSLAPLLRGEQPSTWRQAILIDSAGQLGQDEGMGRHEYPEGGLAWERSRTFGEGGPVIVPELLGLRTRTQTFVRYPNTSEIELYNDDIDPYQDSNVSSTTDEVTVAAFQMWLNSMAECVADGCRSAEESAP